MATMIPDVDPASMDDDNPGEKLAYRALRDQLPGDWTIRWHYPCCWMTGQVLREREADFIVIAPGKGLMVIEVKSSHGFHCEDGKWFRVDRERNKTETRNPFDQASSFKHQLVDRIAARVFEGEGKEDFPGIFGHMVMYPSGKIEGDLPGLSEPEIMVTHKDMHRLKDRIDHAFRCWEGRGSRHPGQGFTGGNVNKVVHFLKDETRGVPVFAANVAEDESKIKDLTKFQFEAFKGLINKQQNRVHVTGPAGSGKTLLASWTAGYLAKEGEGEVLFTCFNRVLAEWLRKVHGTGGQFEVQHFHGLCRQVVTKAGLPFRPSEGGEEQEFWRSQAPRLFNDAIDELDKRGNLRRYNAIIVDEGQDFGEDWWLPLQMLLSDPGHGRLCIFSDRDQQPLYGLGGDYPTGLVSYELRHNCRNTRKIATYCGNILRKQIETSPFQPEGVAPVVKSAEGDPDRRREIVRETYEQFIEEGFRPSQIAILSPLSKRNPLSTLNGLSLGDVQIVGKDNGISQWRDDKAVWGSTVKAFKGLEASCVILTDISPGDCDEEMAECYVGSSRAKHVLVLIPRSELDQGELEGFLRGG